MAGSAKIQTAKPMELAGLIDYQEGAVVSREVMRNQAGTVTVFAFDAGQGLSEHTAPFDAMVQVLYGSAEITIGGKPVEVGEGQFVIMPANVPHALQSRGRFKMALVMLRG